MGWSFGIMNSVGNSMCHTAGKQQPLLAICCSFKAAANCHLHENAWHSLYTRHSFSIRHKGELCIKFIRSLVQGRIHKLKNCVNSRPKSVFKDQETVKCLSSLHDK